MPKLRTESWIPERDRGPSRDLLEDVMAWAEDPDTFYDRCEAEGMSKEEAENLLWWIEHGNRYRERPVSVRQFLFSRAYMRALDETGEPVLWPKLVDAIERVCNGSYVESVWTGAIGTGKTTGALYVLAYKLYELLCLVSPHATYALDPSSEIVMIFQSLNKDLAEDVDFTRFKEMLDRAPIFSTIEFKYDRSIKSELRFARHVKVKPVVGLESGVLSQNVIGGLQDEISSMAVIAKSARTKDKEAYDQAVALYNSISRRRSSRFMDQGEVAGMLCLVGSKKYPDDFLHDKLAEARDEPKRIHTYDEVLWDVKPWAYGKKRFRVFLGDLTRKPRILEEGEELPGDEALIMRVPIEFRPEFERDMLGALRDVAGHSVLSIHPFILNRDKLAAVFRKVRAVGSRPDVDFQDTKLRVFPGRWFGTEDFPRYAHLDTALSEDSAALAIGHVRGFKRLKRSQAVDELLPIVVYDLILEIRPPRAGEIQFEKIRRLLYLLREHGMPIKWVSADSFQSSDLLQILASKGFLVGQESVDKNPGIYEVLKTAIYDERVEAPEHPKALMELTRLERDPKTGKVDHPIHGSKDCADAMATVAFGLSMQSEVWTSFGVDLRHVPETLLEQAEREQKHMMPGRGYMA